MKEFWDSRYKEPAFAYGTRPNEFFQENIDKLSTGKILLPAEGEGRNAVYAARKGWEVSAFDYSVQAMIKTFQLAERYDATLHYTVQDVANFVPSEAFYDVVGLFYTHFPIELRPTFYQKVKAALKPSGLVMVEGFHKNQKFYQSGGPKDETMLFSLEEFQNAFEDCEMILLEDKIIDLDEGLYHQGKAHVVRMIARKLL
jgi:SAM-dependent methyltransferase